MAAGPVPVGRGCVRRSLRARAPGPRHDQVDAKAGQDQDDQREDRLALGRCQLHDRPPFLFLAGAQPERCRAVRPLRAGPSGQRAAGSAVILVGLARLGVGFGRGPGPFPGLRPLRAGAGRAGRRGGRRPASRGVRPGPAAAAAWGTGGTGRRTGPRCRGGGALARLRLPRRRTWLQWPPWPGRAGPTGRTPGWPGGAGRRRTGPRRGRPRSTGRRRRGGPGRWSPPGALPAGGLTPGAGPAGDLRGGGEPVTGAPGRACRVVPAAAAATAAPDVLAAPFPAPSVAPSRAGRFSGGAGRGGPLPAVTSSRVRRPSPARPARPDSAVAAPPAPAPSAVTCPSSPSAAAPLAPAAAVPAAVPAAVASAGFRRAHRAAR